MGLPHKLDQTVVLRSNKLRTATRLLLFSPVPYENLYGYSFLYPAFLLLDKINMPLQVLFKQESHRTLTALGEHPVKACHCNSFCLHWQYVAIVVLKQAHTFFEAFSLRGGI